MKKKKIKKKREANGTMWASDLLPKSKRNERGRLIFRILKKKKGGWGPVSV